MSRPNIVVFFTDQQRWDCSGLHGNPLGLMPNFDRLAQRGTHLANFFTCQPVCGPARSCLQTGQFASANGSWRNGIPLTSSVPHLASYFNEAGYRTGYIGKWHLAQGGRGPVGPEERGGYQDWLASNVLEYTSSAFETVLYDEQEQPVMLPGYRSDAVTDAAIRYLQQHKDDPFFLFLSFIEPHHQNHIDDYPPPDGYREAYAGKWVPPDLAALGGSTQQHLGGYYGMVKRLDEGLGRLMDALRSLRLEENTIVLFFSDHGCHFKTRNGEYKRSCHESSIRVPAMAYGGPFLQGGRREELLSLIDIPPTLLDTAGIDVPEHMHGTSFLPLVERQAEAWTDHVYFETSEAELGRGVRTERWKYHLEAPPGTETQDGRAAVYQEAFLYDLQADPYELTNLIGCSAYDDIVAGLRSRLLARLAAVGESPEILPAPARPAGGRMIAEAEVATLATAYNRPGEN